MRRTNCCLFLLYAFFTFGCLAASNSFSPEDKIWRHENSDVQPIEIVFKKDNILEFVNGFKWLSPAKWDYDPKKNNLKFILNNATANDFAVFKKTQSEKVDSYNRPLLVDETKKMVVYHFPGKILFLGYVFEEKVIGK